MIVAPLATTLDVHELFSPFCLHHDSLGQLVRISPSQLPDRNRKLVDHLRHMTQELMCHHHSSLKVETLADQQQDDLYQREILLRRVTDKTPVQYGFVHLNLVDFNPLLIQQICAGVTPIGQLLADHEVQTQIQLAGFYRLSAGVRIEQLTASTTLWGRHAIIQCNGKPALQVLEFPLT